MGFSLYTEQGIHTDEFCFVMRHGKAKIEKIVSDEAKGNKVRGYSCGKEQLRDKIFRLRIIIINICTELYNRSENNG